MLNSLASFCMFLGSNDATGLGHLNLVAVFVLCPIRYDNCYSGDLPGPKVRYPIMRDALNATGRRIFYSMCEWGEKDPATWARTVGNSWRTTPDIMPNWTLTLDIAYKNNEWAEYAGPGGDLQRIYGDDDGHEDGNYVLMMLLLMMTMMMPETANKDMGGSAIIACLCGMSS